MQTNANLAVLNDCTSADASAFVVAKTLERLTKLAKSGMGWDALLGSGSFESLLDAALKQIADRQIAYRVCDLFQMLAEGGASDGIATGAVPLVLTAIVRHEIHAEVIRAAFRALRFLARLDCTPGVFAEHGGMAITMHCLVAYCHDEDVVTLACSFLGNLCATKKRAIQADVLMAAGGGAQFLQLLTDCKQASTAVAILWLLHKLGLHSRVALHKLGVAAVVVSTMERFNANAFVARKACALLCNLYGKFDNDDSVPPAATDDVVGAIMHALSTHGSIAKVAAYGCAALSAIAHDDGVERVAVQTGGVQMAVRMLMMHGDTDCEVAQEACRALTNMTQCVEGKQAAHDANVCLVATKLIERHYQSAGVVNYGIGVLAMLFRTRKTDRLTSHGCTALYPERVVLAGLHAHGDNAALVEIACHALRYLTRPDTAADIVRHGGVAMLLQALTAHGADYKVARPCMRALGWLCQFPDSGARAACVSSFELVRDIATLHPVDAKIAAAGLCICGSGDDLICVPFAGMHFGE